MRQRKLQHGFTLVELMLVMVIMAILALIGLNTFMGSQKRSRDSRRKGDLTQVSKALEMYFNDNGRYPSSGIGGTIQGCSGGTVDCAWGGQFADTTKNPDTIYMQKLPADPQNYSYTYESDGNGTFYRLYARLENKDDTAVQVGGVPQVYTATCGSIACNYVIVSPNAAEPSRSAE